MVRKYCVAGHTFAVYGNELCNEVLKIDGFVPFAASDDAQVCFSFHFISLILCPQIFVHNINLSMKMLLESLEYGSAAFY